MARSYQSLLIKLTAARTILKSTTAYLNTESTVGTTHVACLSSTGLSSPMPPASLRSGTVVGSVTDSDVEESIQRQLLPTKAIRKSVIPAQVAELRSTPRRASKRVTSGSAAGASPAKKRRAPVKPESDGAEGEGEDIPIVYSNGRTTPALSIAKPRGRTPRPILNSPQASVPIGNTTPTRSLISTLETRYTQLELDLAAERALRVRLEKEIEELRVLRKKETIQRLSLEQKMEEYEEKMRVEEDKWRAEIRELVQWRDRVRKAVDD